MRILLVLVFIALLGGGGMLYATWSGDFDTKSTSTETSQVNKFHSIDSISIAENGKHTSYVGVRYIFEDDKTEGTVEEYEYNLFVDDKKIYTSLKHLQAEYVEHEKSFVISEKLNPVFLYNVETKKLSNIQNPDEYKYPEYKQVGKKIYKDNEIIDSGYGILHFITDKHTNFYAYIRDNAEELGNWNRDVIVNGEVVHSGGALQNLQFSQDRKTYIYLDYGKRHLFIHKNGKVERIEGARSPRLAEDGSFVIYETYSGDGYTYVEKKEL